MLVKVGISAKSLAEPLRDIVPEVFEEHEKEEMARSVAKLMSDSTTPTIDLTTPTIGSTVSTDDSSTIEVPPTTEKPNEEPNEEPTEISTEKLTEEPTEREPLLAGVEGSPPEETHDSAEEDSNL